VLHSESNHTTEQCKKLRDLKATSKPTFPPSGKRKGNAKGKGKGRGKGNRRPSERTPWKTGWTAAALSLLPLQLYLSIVTMDMLLQHLLLHGVKQ
jgi:hypothetical protein